MDWDDITDKLSIVGDRVGRSLGRVFGSRNERFVQTLQPLIVEINGLEPWAQGLSAEEMQAETVRMKAEVASGETSLDDCIPKAFALVREASVRTLGMRHFDVQLVGGIVLHRGAIAEMMTGEGKTLVATLPLYLNALTGETVYLVTVNDYLARRDANWMAPIFRYLGLTIGSIQSSMEPSTRHPVYACDVVYATNNELGFDYLRDNMKTRLEDQVQKTLSYAIVDEVDSILIDEARTPLIISGPAESGANKYALADEVARKLVRSVEGVDGGHFEVKEKERSATLLEDGIDAAEKMVGVDSFYTPGNEDWPHFIENALRAHNLYVHDKEYVVEEGEVVIVDEFTGRKMAGRRWSDGLHQAVEVKEGLAPRRENQTLATITYQNYFKMFSKLAGMTGTAITEAAEFLKIYELDVVTVPTHMPLIRDDAVDVVYRTAREKWNAIVEEIEETQATGQPVLVGTTSIEKSEHIAKLLRSKKVRHEVLNAKNHEREASIVACAGEKGAVTVSTNMAGRGTDIKLGGNFEYRLSEALSAAGLEEGDVENLEAINAIREEIRTQCEIDEQEVLGCGGLYVLGTERHEARRIDNQLRGRAGRQGNSGTSRFFLSLEDDLMRIFYRDWVTNAMERLGMTEGQQIESNMVTRAIARAQKKVEDRNFEIRKSLLEYDEVMDAQRKQIYGTRQEVLEGVALREKVFSMFERSVYRSCATYEGDAEGFSGWYLKTFGASISDSSAAAAVAGEESDPSAVFESLEEIYSAREETIQSETMRKLENYILLNAVDSRWKDHLYAMDSLKAGIGLRGYGQVDPKTEYKREGFELFARLFEAIEDEVTSLVLRIRLAGEEGTPAPNDDGGLEAKGMGPGTEMDGAAMARRQAAARAAQGGRAPQRRAVPASQAFDAMKQRQVHATRAQAAQAAQGAKSAPAEKPEPKSKEAAPSSSAPAASASSEYEGVGRNDSCPCGSGKKFKKCHGKAEA
ncbi:MAG: preprotein translocase subunit SecA [Planctomycetota bacterium]|nr:preprotein translocase subunit SecA [Planctomycetota bacterium]